MKVRQRLPFFFLAVYLDLIFFGSAAVIPGQAYQAGIEKELAAIRADLAALRQLMEENKNKEVEK